MIRTALIALGLVTGLVAAPAAAVTYDAFASFNGTQGAGGFVYGYASDNYDNGNLFAVNTDCFIAGSVCLQQAANRDVPGVTKSTTTSFQYGSVNVPDDRLLLHPGPDGATNGTVFVAFVAPISAIYNINISLSIQDNNPTGVDVGYFFDIITSPTAVTSLGAQNLTFAGSGSVFLNAGQAIGLTFNRQGNYGSDSVGLNFTLATVPEPASWALMITGFGLVGIGLRRKVALAA